MTSVLHSARKKHNNKFFFEISSNFERLSVFFDFCSFVASRILKFTLVWSLFQIKCRRLTKVRSFYWTKKWSWTARTITSSQNASTSRRPKTVTRSVNSILWVVVFLLNIYYNDLLLIIFILCYFNTKFVLNELFSCMFNKFRILIFSSLVLDSLHQLEPDMGRMAVRWSHLQNDRRDFWQARHGPPESKKLVLHSTSMIHFKWDFRNDIVKCGFNKFKTITINK